MSRTFTSRPSCQTNARGTSRRTSQSEDRSRAPAGRGLSKAGTTSRTRNNRNMSSFPGAGHSLNRSSNAGQIEAPDRHTAAPPQDDQARRGNYASGYTVFSPNEKKRQEIAQMAQRGTQAYEKYKQANAVTHVSHIGKVGGGTLTEEEVRAKQAHALRAQKLIRQQKQEEQRQAKKRAEDLKTEEMRAEARKKAERNAARESQNTSAAEVRRKREPFLQQLENNSSTGPVPAGPVPAGPTHRPVPAGPVPAGPVSAGPTHRPVPAGPVPAGPTHRPPQASSYASASQARHSRGAAFHTSTTRSLPKKPL